ncbi:type II toxin-antitoxin system Phd/YefM family antitoxin [Endozoicomonas sp. Mp262]|uniref:type II toxin-antitoxin system Phd/YefM family antitoxin n=1 Tax=Endozoicomonas sp. Mp262 TaxID=2919499 RepID=UPI0021DB224C
MKHHDYSDSGAAEPVTLTQLRKNIFQMVDEVIATGKPLTLTRNGCSLVLAVQHQEQSKLARLKPRNTVIGDLDSLESEDTGLWDADHGFD